MHKDTEVGGKALPEGKKTIKRLLSKFSLPLRVKGISKYKIDSGEHSKAVEESNKHDCLWVRGLVNYQIKLEQLPWNFIQIEEK